MDYGHKQSDVMLKDLEKRIRDEYEKAAKGVEQSMLEFLETFRADDKIMKQKLPDKEYREWRKQQMVVNYKWMKQREDLVNTYMNADQVASKLMKDHQLDVYALNINYGTYEIEKGLNINTNFTMYDKDTVARLLKDNPKLLPPPGKVTSERIRKGELRRWNRQQVQSAMTQGILQGQSIDKIAKHLAKTVGEKNEYQHYRAARTMTTSAENAGRIDAYRRAEGLGIKMKKQWLAAHDSRTRKTHRHYDGMAIPINEEFATNLAFPGDPLGPAEEVYNCRCTLVASFDGFETDFSKEFTPVGFDNYKDWEVGHKIVNTVQSTATSRQKRLSFYSKKLDNALGANYNDFEKIVNNSETKGMYNEFVEKCEKYICSKDGGCYRTLLDHVEFSIKSHVGMSPYSTVAHEIGHMMDSKMGRVNWLTFKENDLINARCGAGRWKPLKTTPSQSDEFLAAVRKDMSDMRQMTEYEWRKMLVDESRITRNATIGVQDALDGFYSAYENRAVAWHHGDKYYNRFYNDKIKQRNTQGQLKQVYKELGFDASNQEKVRRISRQYEAASEAWANGMSALTCGGQQLKAMEQYMPNTMKLLRDIAARY